MKDQLDLQRVQDRMQPGVISLDGFLGDDARPLEQILRDDDAAVRALGLTHAAIAERLKHFTDLAYSGFGTPLRDGDFEVVIIDARGQFRCPFGDTGRIRKGEILLRNLKTGGELVWTPILLHLIEAHGFYEGRGSRYRLEPETIKRVLELA